MSSGMYHPVHVSSCSCVILVVALQVQYVQLAEVSEGTGTGMSWLVSAKLEVPRKNALHFDNFMKCSHTISASACVHCIMIICVPS